MAILFTKTKHYKDPHHPPPKKKPSYSENKGEKKNQYLFANPDINPHMTDLIVYHWPD